MTALVIAACAMGAVLLVVAVTWWIDRPTPNEKFFDRANKLGYSDSVHSVEAVHTISKERSSATGKSELSEEDAFRLRVASAEHPATRDWLS